MDEFLADYYQTNTPEFTQEDELEKMAQLTLLTKEAAAENIDLSEFSDEELVQMAGELYGGEAAPEADEDELQKEAAAKFEEADFLGRVMAHSFNQELGNIEKEAGRLESAGRALEAIPGRIRAALGRGKERVVGAGGRAVEKIKATPEAVGQRLLTKKERGAILTRFAGSGQSPYEEMARVARRRGAVALGAGGAALGAGAGGGAYALSRRKEKKSADSAFEQLVIERANEHLDAAGYFEKEASEEDFSATVDRAALELLEANGYPVEWY